MSEQSDDIDHIFNVQKSTLEQYSDLPEAEDKNLLLIPCCELSQDNIKSDFKFRSTLLDTLCQRILQLLSHSRKASIVDNKIVLSRISSNLSYPYSTIAHPMFALTVQGSKISVVGDMQIRYASGQVFLLDLDMPTKVHILDASVEKPCVTFFIALDPTLITEVVQQLPEVSPQELNNINPCASLIWANESFIMSCLKILDLYEAGVSHLYPYDLIIKELYYQVLSSPCGQELRKLYCVNSPNYKIAQAIDIINQNYKNDMSIDDLALQVNMTVTSFYKYFKQITSLSPLQYIKRLRLYESKRIMTMHGFSAANAGYEVGYSSEQHFSRDYKKLFGLPPMQDVRERPFVLELTKTRQKDIVHKQ